MAIDEYSCTNYKDTFDVDRPKFILTCDAGVICRSLLLNSCSMFLSWQLKANLPLKNLLKPMRRVAWKSHQAAINNSRSN